MRKLVAVVAMFCLAVGGLSPAVAKDKDKGKHGGKGRGAKVKVVYRGGGPPPWAPAHGYRHQHTRGGPSAVVVPVAVPYAAPFHLDLGRCNRGALGSVLGGAAGGLLGSQVGDGAGRTAAIIGGTILGVIVGGSVGRSMDDLDQACVGQMLEHVPTGQAVEWVNPDTGRVYQTKPTDTYQGDDGRYCREYQTTVQIGGRAQEAYGTACRQPDGSWERM